MTSLSGSSNSRRRASDFSGSQASGTSDTSHEIPPGPNFAGLEDLAPPAGELEYPFRLPCEFAAFGCRLEFVPDAQGVGRWITHLEVDHLHHKLPRRAACWFCDDVLFDSGGDEGVNLDHRMWHIFDHLYAGEPGPRRPDYWMLDHVREHGLADPGDVTRVMINESEGPRDPTFRARGQPQEDVGPRSPETVDRQQQVEEARLRTEERRAMRQRRQPRPYP